MRYDRSVGTNTSLKFMTDGILLRELQLDFLLHAYSAIVVDEAHERALNTDLLLGESCESAYLILRPARIAIAPEACGCCCVVVPLRTAVCGNFRSSNRPTDAPVPLHHTSPDPDPFPDR